MKKGTAKVVKKSKPKAHSSSEDEGVDVDGYLEGLVDMQFDEAA